MDTNILKIFNPDPDAAIQQLRPYISDEHLLSIATLDDGYDRDEHFIELKRLRDEPYEGRRMQAEPGSVLELACCGFSHLQHGEPPGPFTKEDAKLCRAFIVANILRSLPNCDYFGVWANEFIAIGSILNMCKKLEMLDEVNVMSLYAWVLPRLTGHDQESPFIAVGLIDLALDANLKEADEAIAYLANWALLAETYDVQTGGFGRGWFRRDYQAKMWVPIGEKFCQMDLKRFSTQTQKQIDEIGALLMGNA